ncbi:MAG: HAD-IA family hydrolase, partial [Candidatus Obscuribacterales bacterium]|nr:HAD-IA family hydrolase [Steroidobacteraceae bacterium]
LNWYCTDYWSLELALDIVALKRSARTRIAWLPGAERFLFALRRASKRLLLVTNAHGDSLCIKDECTGIRGYFDAAISSHSYGHPKEHSAFWQRLQREHYFDPARTLFIDDSLPVLRAAREFGIARVVAVTHPDSQLKQRECEEFPAVTRVVNLLPCASA